MSSEIPRENSDLPAQGPRPYTIGSPEYFKGFTKFSDHWSSQTKDDNAKAEKEAARIKKETNAVNTQATPAPELRKWIPASETSIARLSYRLRELPMFYLVTVQILQQEGKDWTYVYSRKHRQSAWDEIFNTMPEYKSMNNIAVVNMRTPTHKHEDHLIVPSGDFSVDQKLKLLPAELPLTCKVPRGTGAKQPAGLAMKCVFTSIILYKEEDAHLTIYKKSLERLIRSRMARPPRRIVPFVLDREGIATKREQVKHCGLWLRSRVSLDVTQKVLYMDVDVAALVPSNKEVLSIISQVFGDIETDEVRSLEPYLRDLLEGVYVQRTYEAKKGADEKTKATFKTPFQIRSVMSNQAAKSDRVRRMKDQPKYKGKTEEELENEDSVDTYDYFKKNYNGGIELENTHLPVVGDGTGAYFPVQMLVTCRSRQYFPGSKMFAPAFKRLTNALGLLDISSDDDIARFGDRVFNKIANRRAFEIDDEDTEDESKLELRPFLMTIDSNDMEGHKPFDFERVDPIKFFL